MGLNHVQEQSFRTGEAVSVPSEIVGADALCHFPELVRELGGDPESLLRRARIDSTVFCSDRSVIEYRAFVQVLNFAAEALSCPDFGLRLAELRKGRAGQGPLGVVMRNSKTLGDALDYCAGHAHAFSNATHVRLEPYRGRKVLFHLEVLPGQLLDTVQVFEHALGMASFTVRELTGNAVQVREVLFSHEPLCSPSKYRAFFGCSVSFGQDVDGYVLTEEDLSCPTVRPDSLVYEMATSFIETRYPHTDAPISTHVRKLVLQYLGHANCTNERIAAELCMHPRTLLRRLRAEGTSFEDIKDDVRREAVLRYLRENMPLIRVAERLGYAETSVLSRSCYRWFSASPRQLRMQLRREQSALGKVDSSEGRAAAQAG